MPQTINLATYGVAIGMYANSLWPQINAKWFGIAALSVFFAINLCGVDVMAKVQKISGYPAVCCTWSVYCSGMPPAGKIRCLSLQHQTFFSPMVHPDSFPQSCCMYIQQTDIPAL